MFGNWNIIREERKKSRNKIILFSLISAVFSAVAAVFLTPKSGREMRKIAAHKAKEAGKSLQENSAKFGDEVRSASVKVMEKGQELMDTGKEKLEQAKQQTQKKSQNDEDKE